jgi:ATP-dependent DNA helicase DinG
MDTTEWDIAFAPVMALGREVRTGQSELGQAIFNAINSKTTLVGQAPVGTGKSFAAAVPLISKVLEAKKKKGIFRAAMSTETITLQNQIANKDLPFLQTLYPGFSFKKLMGRSNYLCLNAAHLSGVGNFECEQIYQKLLKREHDLGPGELSDVERVLGREVDAELWRKLQGDQNFCVDNDCQPERCFAAKARAEALEADIVVVNHALLGVDAELKARNNDAFGEGVLGSLQCLIVDEAHALEPVLVSQWTEELTQWQVSNYIESMLYTVNRCASIKGPYTWLDKAQDTSETIYEIFNNLHHFFEVFAEETQTEWHGFEAAVSLKYLSNSISLKLVNALNKYETTNVDLLKKAITQLIKCQAWMLSIWAYLSEFAVKIEQKRKFSKGFRSIDELIKTLTMLLKALETKDGIIDNYGKTGVIFQGWVSKDGTNKMTLRMVPLDVSLKASTIWKNVNTSIMISATLMDLTDSSFKYSRRCVGFPTGPEINVATPFDYATKQLIYKTTATGQRVENAQYCLSELQSLVEAAEGRSLILFTAKKELEYAAEELRRLKYLGSFPYQILVQEDGANKQKLLEEFKTDTHSVLLGLKSFFVGVDVPGEALSHVAICKFPLARYSIECKMRIVVWREKGFPRWYERESLTTLAQAAGRLIRTTDDHGVISILDFRVVDPKQNVYAAAELGITALGSPVTNNISEVRAFLANHVQLTTSTV